MSTARTKALVAYVRLTRMPRERLSELDLSKLEQAEAVVRDLNGLELIEILRANPQTMRL